MRLKAASALETFTLMKLRKQAEHHRMEVHEQQKEELKEHQHEANQYRLLYSLAQKQLKAKDASLAQAIEEREVTCLVGLEQGGLVAAMVAARAALGESGSCSRLRAAVVCGAAMPASSQHAALLHRLRDGESNGASPSAVPTLHCLSEADSVHPQGEELAACFGTSAEILWHDLGNALPSRQWWKDSDAFLERAWQARWSNGRLEM